MKKILILVVLFVMSYSFILIAQNDINKDITAKEKVEILMSIESGSVCLTQTEEEKYFYALPDNFEELIQMYSQPWNYNGRVLWLSFGHRLRNLYYIDKERVLLKLFNMSKKGYWEDSPAVDLQMVIQPEFAKNVKVASIIMSETSDEDIISFWHFYFDGPHPKNYQKDFEELQRRYKEYDNRIAELMKSSFEKLLLENDNH